MFLNDFSFSFLLSDPTLGDRHEFLLLSQLPVNPEQRSLSTSGVGHQLGQKSLCFLHGLASGLNSSLCPCLGVLRSSSSNLSRLPVVLSFLTSGFCGLTSLKRRKRGGEKEFEKRFEWRERKVERKGRRKKIMT